MKFTAATLVAALGLAAGCAATPSVTAPAVPASLQPPANQAAAFEILAEGVQIYECTAGEWKFKGPEAVLMDRNGRPMGKHYGGPTWGAVDGSTVVAELVSRADSPDRDAIPHLLLRAKSHGGNGMYTGVRSIQRVDTVGGKVPAHACTQDKAAQVARVPYKATYYLYLDKA